MNKAKRNWLSVQVWFENDSVRMFIDAKVSENIGMKKWDVVCQSV